MPQTHIDEARNIKIVAESITIGRDVSFGRNIDIALKGEFTIGDRSRLGDSVHVRARSFTIGEDLFHSSGLRVGGGGRQHPNARVSIGDRCTIHDNFINACEEVTIGHDVGLSPAVSILTHGYWLNVLDGFPAKFAGVRIEDGVIVGYRSLIMMGVTIGARAVIGAQALVTSNLEADGIYGGNPAKLIRKIAPMDPAKRPAMVDKILAEYREIAEYHGIDPKISVEYPWITVNQCRFNVETLAAEGTEDAETDDFRDYVRKWGLRFYTGRPFRSVFEW